MAKDFIGQDLHIGDKVIYLDHHCANGKLEKGISYVGQAVNDFLHVEGKDFNATKEYVDNMVSQYKLQQNKLQQNKPKKESNEKW